jgi:hypothetical protein
MGTNTIECRSRVLVWTDDEACAAADISPNIGDGQTPHEVPPANAAVGIDSNQQPSHGAPSQIDADRESIGSQVFAVAFISVSSG